MDRLLITLSLLRLSFYFLLRCYLVLLERQRSSLCLYCFDIFSPLQRLRERALWHDRSRFELTILFM